MKSTGMNIGSIITKFWTLFFVRIYPRFWFGDTIANSTSPEPEYLFMDSLEFSYAHNNGRTTK